MAAHAPHGREGSIRRAGWGVAGMKTLILLGAALAASAAVAWVRPASAAVGLFVPPATLSTQCVDVVPLQSSGGPGLGVCNVPGGTALVVGQPWVALEAQVNDSGSIATQLTQASLEYFFVITGGTPGAAVPIDITLDLLSQGSNGGYAFASFSAGPGGGLTAVSTSVCNNALCTNSQFHGTLQYTAIVGQIQQVDLEALAEGGFFASAFASADPLIFVDPSFPGASQLPILLSPGIANALPPTGVPEPSAWALLLAGFASLGAILRRRLARVGPPSSTPCRW